MKKCDFCHKVITGKKMIRVQVCRREKVDGAADVGEERQSG